MIKDFHSFNEKLSKSDKYVLKNAFYILGNRLISWIIKAEPLLNEIFIDLKKKTRGQQAHKDLGSAGLTSTIKNIEKINIDEIKGTKYYRGLYRLMNKWNLYKHYFQSGSFYYILSKDDLSEGDVVAGNHKNWKVGNVRIAVCAKYDKNEFLDECIDEIKDIFSDLDLNYDVEIQKAFRNRENSMIYVKFDSRKRIENGRKFDQDFLVSFNEMIQRSLGSLKFIGEKWDYVFYFWDNERYLRRLRGDFRRQKDAKYGWVNARNMMISDLTKHQESEIFLVFHRIDIADYHLKYTQPHPPIESYYEGI